MADRLVRQPHAIRSPARPSSTPGLDISADKGEPVYATADGTVETAGPTGAYGNMVVIDHGFGLSTRYAHLDGFPSGRARMCSAATSIGFVGATGRATGDHLHYEVLVNGRQLNPLHFLLNRPTRSRGAFSAIGAY